MGSHSAVRNSDPVSGLPAKLASKRHLQSKWYPEGIKRASKFGGSNLSTEYADRNLIWLRRDSCNLFSGPLSTRGDTLFRPLGFFLVYGERVLVLQCRIPCRLCMLWRSPLYRQPVLWFIPLGDGQVVNDIAWGLVFFGTWRHIVWYT